MGTIVRTINVSFQLIINSNTILPIMLTMFLIKYVKLFEIADLA